MTDLVKQRGLNRALMNESPLLVLLDVAIDQLRHGHRLTSAGASHDRRRALRIFHRQRCRLIAAARRLALKERQQ